MAKHKSKVHEIDFKYRAYLKKICINSLSLYRGVPLSWEDIYNNFLFEAPSILKDYNKKLEISEKTFLGIKCKYFALNYCRSFETNKHKIMNGAGTLVTDRTVVLNDAEQEPAKLDTSVFTDEEFVVYTKYFLEGKSLETVSKEMDESTYVVRKTTGKIRNKLAKQIKK